MLLAITDNRCETQLLHSCKHLVDANKTTKITELSSVLIVHIKRFVKKKGRIVYSSGNDGHVCPFISMCRFTQNYRTGRITKNDTDISYKHNLHLEVGGRQVSVH